LGRANRGRGDDSYSRARAEAQLQIRTVLTLCSGCARITVVCSSNSRGVSGTPYEQVQPLDDPTRVVARCGVGEPAGETLPPIAWQPTTGRTDQRSDTAPETRRRPARIGRDVTALPTVPGSRSD
jgi:hypothetical protein